ncbi:hypothetical protein [Lacipirellula sp.]|uniref:hypothetical protein n=1 Tax=Lacipirellula sp. TaxID=2691419 RepID=UPI003D09A3C1
MDDFVIDDAGVHFSASKNLEYRARVVERLRVFVDFLQSNGLATRVILEPGETPSETLKIRRSDLSEAGFQVVLKSYDKWLRGIDKGRAISDTSLLEKALEQLKRS